MDKPSFKLVGAPCGHHGQYTFYKAIKLTTVRERIVAIGDFFFVRIWQDSELVSIGELQLLWTDRVSDQTLVSLRLYFLPENTPDGRNQHGEDEVLAINDKVVLKAEDLLSWVCEGDDWRWGFKAVWRGACAPTDQTARPSAPLHNTKLDFSDVEKEKSAIRVESEAAGVVVFSYPQYCRYRALVARLEGVQSQWLRDSLVSALGGYAAPTKRTRILFCRDTFEYPELEGHEFVCNHLAPKLKGRPRGRRRRPPRSRTQSPESRSSDEDRIEVQVPSTPRRISLRNGPEKNSSDDEDKEREKVDPTTLQEDQAFFAQLQQFYQQRNEEFLPPTLKHLSLRALYCMVTSRGGYEAVCKHKQWRVLFADQPSHTRRHYERYLLPFENHERRNGVRVNGLMEQAVPDNIDVTDSSTDRNSPKPNVVDCETGEVKEDINIVSKPAEELNQEFLDSLPMEEKPAKITVKPVEKLLEQPVERAEESSSGVKQEVGFIKDIIPPQNGHAPPLIDQKPRPIGRSSLRAVRVKPTRHMPPMHNNNTIPIAVPGWSPPASNFGIHHPPTHAITSHQQQQLQHISTRSQLQDDDVQEVPYQPEIIDVDNYPESPQLYKKKKLDILKERGLEVTPLPTPAWPGASLAVPGAPIAVPGAPLTGPGGPLAMPGGPLAVPGGPLAVPGAPLAVPGAPLAMPGPPLAVPGAPLNPMLASNPMLLNPVVQHQIMTNAQLYQMYNIVPNYPNGTQPPKVIQATSIFGNSSPEKTVYGNPKDPFMPPPHVLHGAPIKPLKTVAQIAPPPPQDILDLTCKLTKPAIEIVRVPTAPSPSKSTPQNLTKNYSIIDGKAVLGSNLEITLVNKTLSPVKRDIRPQKRSSNGKFLPKTPTLPKETPKMLPPKKTPIIVPNYQISREDPPPPQKEVQKPPPIGFLDPYMTLYNITGQMDPRQLAAYRDIMTNQMKGYSNLLNMGVNPTTKN